MKALCFFQFLFKLSNLAGAGTHLRQIKIKKYQITKKSDVGIFY
jgi:hypothetical protein